MELIGRAREVAVIEDLLRSAVAGRGALVVLVGGTSSGKTALAEAAVTSAHRHGMEVLRVDPAGLPEAAAGLVSARPRLIIVDGVDPRGPGPDLLAVAGTGLPSSRTAILATSTAVIGTGTELRLHGLTTAQLGEILPGLSPQELDAVALVSRGNPGRALSLAPQLWDRDLRLDPLVHLALAATSATAFLEVDRELVRVLEAALTRAEDPSIRARLMSMLARELLGDVSAADRRRGLVEEALVLARGSGDAQALAAALDARLHALWDPAGAEDRLAAASEIINVSLSGEDEARQRLGLFWRFVALMELGRVGEAESALAAFAAACRHAGDSAGTVMATARYAMLATLRGRFGEAERLTEEVSVLGRRSRVPDTDILTATLRGNIRAARGDPPAEGDADALLAAASSLPGHLYEATAARILAASGAGTRARLELDRVLPSALTGSGPRWVGAMADLAVVAALVHDASAAERLYRSLRGFDGRLVVFGGANTCTGPVAYYLGLLARTVGDCAAAVAHFSDAAALAERIGALPSLAQALVQLSGALRAGGREDESRRAELSASRGLDLAERLGMAGPAAPVTATPRVWMLTRDGTDWTLTTDSESARLRASRGLQYLRELLAAPRREISALDLAAGGPGLRDSGLGPVIDASARRSYQARLAALSTELDAADARGDAAAARGAEQERQAILDELRRATGLAGRPRGSSSEAERARVNVTRALRSALARIGESAPVAAAHLQASVRTGRACRYDPAPGGPQRWLC